MLFNPDVLCLVKLNNNLQVLMKHIVAVIAILAPLGGELQQSEGIVVIIILYHQAV